MGNPSAPFSAHPYGSRQVRHRTHFLAPTRVSREREANLAVLGGADIDITDHPFAALSPVTLRDRHPALGRTGNRMAARRGTADQHLPAGYRPLDRWSAYPRELPGRAHFMEAKTKVRTDKG